MKELFYINPSSIDRDMKNLGKALREMVKDLDKSVQVVFEKAFRKKTLPQNSYFHLLAGMICKFTGENLDDFKYSLKIELGYYVDVKCKNSTEKRPRSLSKASLEDLIIFIDSAMTICDELEIRFMLPDEYYRKIGVKQ